MQLFKKTLGLIAILSICPAAFAATSRGDAAARVGVTGAASRMPKIVTTVSTGTTTTTATGATTTAAALLENTECIDAYSECIRAGDVCGENFEECTTSELFHAQMPKCLSTLMQCSSAGVKALFGTDNLTALSTSNGTDASTGAKSYAYPSAGSWVAQWIDSAAILNRYDTSTCVRRYTSCLRKDSVCGEDFELCTSDSEFKKQRLFCESTLARCENDGIKELFGSTNKSATPSADSRLGVLIKEGQELAATNAVGTCYKVVDQCILNACSENPFKCKENSSEFVAALADGITDGDTEEQRNSTLLNNANDYDLVNSKSVKSYIQDTCGTTIGANKYCYMTVMAEEGKTVVTPTPAQLRDPENQEEVFDWLYSARLSMLKTKIDEQISAFDITAKKACTNTVKSCAMRVCGGGSGAACYTQAFKKADSGNSINAAPYNEIQEACEMIVNADANCQYAYYSNNSSAGFTPKYTQNGVFTYVFPAYGNGNYVDSIGVVATLNSLLATSYNDAAIANMKKQCQSVATSCVKSMCGTDYVNCYRNRTDVYSNLTNTENAAYNQSMNKVSGVLDYTVVLGLCLDTVKNASVCEEHLAIEKSKLSDSKSTTDGWGSGLLSVRETWATAGNAAVTGKTKKTDDNGNELCTDATGAEGICNTVSASGIYENPEYVDYQTLLEGEAASTLFKDLIYDLEKEAQAKYNAKLTREQNMCLSSNNGGIVGNNENGSTFMWAKLKSNKVPKDYTINGLGTKDFTASNDLYGSFCRVRITLQSDDKTIQEAMRGKNWTTAYFATGDSFTCGSWIPASALESIANKVAEDKAGSINDAAHKRTQFWTTLLGAAGGGVGGYFLGEGIRNGNVFGGLTGLNGTQTTQKTTQQKQGAKNCVDAIREYKSSVEQGASEKTQINNAKAVVLNADTAGVYPTWTEAIKQVLNSEEYTESGMAIALAKMEYEFNALNNQCNGILNNDNIPDKETETRTRWGITAATTGVTALASGLLVYKATRDMQQTLLDDEQKAAYEEFMNSVGRHISCYIGGDEAGSYGDVITTSLE